MTALGGLSSAEAARRLSVDGPNAIPEVRTHWLAVVAAKFWAPVPWLLEVTIVLEVFLSDFVQAGIFTVLLVFNSLLSASQERRAHAAVDLLRQRLNVNARAARDGHWTLVSASDLVVGDLVHVRPGDLVPADLRLSEGSVQMDQSALTGESQSVGAGPGDPGYSGSVVLRGEASGVVVAVGTSTFYGRTAELLSSAHAPGNMERLIFGIVRALMGFALAIVAVVVADGLIRHTPLRQLIPFVLIVVIASIPVALPATFTLATALGSKELSEHHVLVTRLAAIEEAASMEVLCTDKTGTLTQNQLAVEALRALEPFDEDQLLRVSAAASDAATQDPLDLAILAACAARRLAPLGVTRSFVPFEPATKRSEALLDTPGGALRAVKGAPQVVGQMAGADEDALRRSVEELAATGARVLGVAQGAPDATPQMVGLVALADPPREDAAHLVAELRNLGIQVVMLTGDGLATAAAIATRVGIGPRSARADELRTDDVDVPPTRAAREVRPWDRDGWRDLYAEVLPEDKMRLVARLQRESIVVGMTGDGVNDAPALRTAEVGVAVSSATDVAKSAASLVLTTPGLEDLVAGIEVSRRIHQRMPTYTLNKIIKTLQVALFLGVGFVVFGRFVTTPTLVVLLLLANDFPTMSLATDRVRAPQLPQKWRVASLVVLATGLAVPLVLLSFGLWWFGTGALHLDVARMQTVIFVWLVISGQATIFLVREREHFWHSRPSRWLALSSGVDVLVVLALASRGVMMSAVGIAPLGAVLGTVAAYVFVVDVLKGWILHFVGPRG